MLYDFLLYLKFVYLYMLILSSYVIMNNIIIVIYIVSISLDLRENVREKNNYTSSMLTNQAIDHYYFVFEMVCTYKMSENELFPSGHFKHETHNYYWLGL
jgi:hypothetical protein